MASVKLIAVTKPTDDNLTSEQLIAYVARVSSPTNQTKHMSAPRLLAYCLKHGHFSVFETLSMTMEIETSIAISAQILRHRSFTFQQFSGRYAQVPDETEYINPRRQDEKNRQNSIDNLPDETKAWFEIVQRHVANTAFQAYEAALARGIAKECARFLLPQNTRTKLYMTGNLRSWIFYIQTRTHESTQLEHRLVAEEAKRIVTEQFPSVAAALGWASASPVPEPTT